MTSDEETRHPFPQLSDVSTLLTSNHAPLMWLQTG